MNSEKEEVVKKKKKSTKKWIFVAIICLIFVIGVGLYFYFFNNNQNNIKATKKEVKSEYEMAGNDLSAFDIAFLKLENQTKNKVYSPLSIKYALEMLAEGADKETKEQIDRVIGKYKARKYANSKNMSFANALFVKDSYKENIKKEYTSKLKNKYDAEIINDSFQSATNVNQWVKNKTLGLIDKLYSNEEDLSDFDFMLINALAIDMEWVKNIQADSKHLEDEYTVAYKHEEYTDYIPVLSDGDEVSQPYGTIKFNDRKINAKAVQFGATINNYDIVEDLGEDTIRKTVGDKYKQWVSSKECGDDYEYEDVNAFLDRYIEEIDANYQDVTTSTDFYEYHDEMIKVFAKDLKKYNGVTLQYVGIMPIKEKLDSYIKNLKAEDVTKTIHNLKEIKTENYTSGKIIQIKGSTPVFTYNDELNLIEDLRNLGIQDVFNSEKANLSKLTTNKKAFISNAKHKANIEFSNEGIKAAAVTSMGGRGSAGCYFDYRYKVPVETIDLTFENPYMYLIRDKDTGEIWFTGTVYEPTVNKVSNAEILNK